MNSQAVKSAIKLINSEYKPFLQVKIDVMAEVNKMVFVESVKFCSHKSYGGSLKFLSLAITFREATKLGRKKFLKFTLSRQTRQSPFFLSLEKVFITIYQK